MSERALHTRIQAAKGGDRMAFDTLMRPHKPELLRFLRWRVGPGAAEDLLQEVTLAAWTALPHYEGQSAFRTWLYGIALNKCRNYFRSLRSETDASALPEGGYDPYALADLRMDLRRALDHVSPHNLEVLELYYGSQLSLPEIAEVLGRNLNTVKYQLYRAYKEMRGALKGRGVTDDSV